MLKRTSRFIVILSLSVVLPLVIYLIYQISTLRENERIITTVYEDQLKSVLFSVNQYSNDYFSALIQKIETDQSLVDAENHELSIEIQNAGIRHWTIHELDEAGINHLKTYSFTYTISRDTFPHEAFDDFLFASQAQIRQLIEFKAQGYQKLEPAGLIRIDDQDFQSLLVILQVKNQLYLFTGLIDIQSFVEEVLSPKMQQIAGTNLVISVSDLDSQQMLFVTEPITTNINVTTSLWLFPDFLVGVSPKVVTVKQLIEKQQMTAIYMIGAIFLLMAIGIYMILQNQRKEAQLNRAKSDFVSNVSHELRTPLALIRMFAETMLLNRVKSEEKKQEYLEVIFKETNRLTNIVNRILNFSRIEAHRKVYHKQQVNPAELLKEIFRDYSFHLEQNGFIWHLNIPDDVSPIEADREAIYEALIILIDNAMKYSEENKEIIVRLTTSPKSTAILVQDRGIGIASEKLNQIFDKFYRVSDYDQYVTQGAGLGLSILKHIMDAHDGSVQVESKLGYGSTFTLIFENHG